MTTLDSELKFEWCSIEALCELITVLAQASIECNLPLLGRTYDLDSCFQQLALAIADYWKTGI